MLVHHYMNLKMFYKYKKVEIDTLSYLKIVHYKRIFIRK